MPLPLFLLAVVAMIGLAILRLVRVGRGHTPLPDGKARIAFLIAFLVVPPVVAQGGARANAERDPARVVPVDPPLRP